MPRMHPGFTLISLRRYLDLHMKANPREDRSQIAQRLKWAAQEHLAGRRCECGEPMWIIGSAVAQVGCFTCITGSANPDQDYELDVSQPLTDHRGTQTIRARAAMSQPIPPKLQPWIEARKRFGLSDAHVQMARELGMNPKKLGRLANHKQESWKLPLAQFIEKCYRKSFGKSRPDNVHSIERMVRERTSKKAQKKRLKEARRASGQPGESTAVAGAPDARLTPGLGTVEPALHPIGEDELPF